MDRSILLLALVLIADICIIGMASIHDPGFVAIILVLACVASVCIVGFILAVRTALKLNEIEARVLDVVSNIEADMARDEPCAVPINHKLYDQYFQPLRHRRFRSKTQ